MIPVKGLPRVGFPSGSHVTVSCQPVQSYCRPGRHGQPGDTSKALILGLGIGNIIGTLQLYADGKIVALLLALETGSARMPGSVQQADKLNQGAVSADQSMCRHLHVGNSPEIGVGARIETVAEEIFDFRPTELTRGQTDIVYDQKTDGGIVGPGPEVR